MATVTENVNQRILNFLIQEASLERTATYPMVFDSMGIPVDNVANTRLNNALGEITDWCIENGWPILTSLVVRGSGTDRGLPARGFWKQIQKYQVSIGFYPQGEIVDASRRVKESFISLMHHKCYNYFATLRPKVNDEKIIALLGTGIQCSPPLNLGHIDELIHS